MPFKLVSNFKPEGDQPQAIEKLVDGLKRDKRYQTLLGVTGSGKTYTAASVIAKVTRDRLMLELDRQFPAYGFARHKGYPTAAHLAALKQHGVADIHRRSYAPVRKLLEA